MKNNKYISKRLSLVLRHNPGVVGLELGSDGWVNVDVLIDRFNAKGWHVDKNTLIHIVETNDKKRFALSEDMQRIRANQGHSIAVDLGLEKQIPPPILYHGTAQKFVESILEKGIEKRSRQHVHLSQDYDTATKVGARHGQPHILVVNAMDMYDDGYSFFLSQNGVWLTDYVPVQYVT